MKVVTLDAKKVAEIAGKYIKETYSPGEDVIIEVKLDKDFLLDTEIMNLKESRAKLREEKMEK